MQLTPDEKILVSVVKLHPSQVELDDLNALIHKVTNWDLVVERLIAHGSAPLLYNKLPNLSNSVFIPILLRTKLQQAYYKTLSRSMVLYEAFKKVVGAFSEKDIEIIVLKGAYLCEHLYVDIALRQFSDIDILVQKEDATKCLDILHDLGFVSNHSNGISEFVDTHSDFVHYPPMVKNDISVEVHIKLHSRSARYQLVIPEMIARANPVNIAGCRVKTLCTNDLLMHLCVHADKHFLNGQIQLKSFNDIVNILDSLPSDFNWDHFELTCIQNKCEQVVFMFLVLLARYYRAQLPDELYNKYQIFLDDKTEELFIQYLRGNSFEKTMFSAVPSHIHSLQSINKPQIFFRYLNEIIFPSKSFMLQKYKIKHPQWYWFWYPYRWGIGAKGIIRFLKDKIDNCPDAYRDDN